jgi:hypothetical protein
VAAFDETSDVMTIPRTGPEQAASPSTATGTAPAGFRRTHIPRTKIVGTLGPASNTREGIQALVEAGLDVARINFSHGTHEQHARTIATVREVSEALGRPVARATADAAYSGRPVGNSLSLSLTHSLSLSLRVRASEPRVTNSSLCNDFKLGPGLRVNETRASSPRMRQEHPQRPAVISGSQ